VVASGNAQLAFRFATPTLVEEAGHRGQEGGLARSRSAQKEDSLPGLHDEIEVANGPLPTARMAPSPPDGLEGGAGPARGTAQGVDSAGSRPDGNAASTPVGRRRRTRYHEPSPATNAPLRSMKAPYASWTSIATPTK